MKQASIFVYVPYFEQIICHIDTHVAAVCKTLFVAPVFQRQKSHQRLAGFVLIWLSLSLNIMRKRTVTHKAATVGKPRILVDVALVLVTEIPSFYRTNSAGPQVSDL